ncbi:MAG: hypothetical protein CL424_10400 [Acidimicrobiaceae bacterium]|nr:hypothetical protein [Acidimicrobiaceae bacterium]
MSSVANTLPIYQTDHPLTEPVQPGSGDDVERVAQVSIGSSSGGLVEPPDRAVLRDAVLNAVTDTKLRPGTRPRTRVWSRREL